MLRLPLHGARNVRVGTARTYRVKGISGSRFSAERQMALKSQDDLVRGIQGAVLEDLDGSVFTAEALTKTLHLGEVSDFQVVPGSEKNWPQSSSAKIQITLKDHPEEGKVVFLKKVDGRQLPQKSLLDLRRDLASNRNEARFYKEFAPILGDRGMKFAKPLFVDERMDGVDALVGTDAEQEAALRQGGILMFLESAEGFFQEAPFSYDQATCALKMLAQFHGTTWQDAELLGKASVRLQPKAGYWAMHHRSKEEFSQLEANWKVYVEAFTPLAPDLFARQGIADLGTRLRDVSESVSNALWAKPTDPFASLMHGDLKAMNIFLPETSSAQTSALPIDFQWTGVGFGMADVAMHLCHSVSVDALRDGGEQRLVECYMGALAEIVPPQAFNDFKTAALKLYCLGVLDYSRTVISHFFKGASPEKFVERAHLVNVGLCYRNVEASFLFVERVDRCLRMHSSGEYSWTSV